ncbi:MAG: tyrosine-type recombinase/integrase [Gammaproteobacteria bacterium]|nr:tyrosine-type recombinase/integrase [Gammaproteobacteria bacterium]
MKENPEFPNIKNWDLMDICAWYCRQRPLRPATVTAYKGCMSLFCRDTGIRTPEEVTLHQFLQWRDSVVTRSSTTTFNNYYRHLRAVFNYCVELDLMPDNPILQVKPFTRYNTRRKACTEADLKKLCRHIYNDQANHLSPFLLNLVLTLYYTGMRRAQLCGLQWEDIDFSQDTILLRKYHSKSEEELLIPMHGDLRNRLLAMKWDVWNWFSDFSKEDQVFWIQRYSDRYRGERLNPEQLSGIFKRTTAKCGVDVSPHKIRHLVATTLANLAPEEIEDVYNIPASLVALRDILGHRDIKMTVDYIEPKLSSQQQILKKLRKVGNIVFMPD